MTKTDKTTKIAGHMISVCSVNGIIQSYRNLTKVPLVLYAVLNNTRPV